MKESIEKWKQMDAAGDPAAFDYLKEIAARARAEGKTAELDEAVWHILGKADAHLDNIERTLPRASDTLL